ncbi:MAG: hypothetical protein JO057_14980, partial [Chloroflexi bacterium]|nr:hypothetical protein [Chloroflexota bacterium]
MLLLANGLLATQPTTPIVQAATLADSLAPQSGDAVQTKGGEVLHSTTTYAIYWKQVDLSFLGQTFYYEATRCYGPGCLHSYGTDKSYEDATGTFFQDVGGSSWYGILGQYWDDNAPNGQPVPVFNESHLGGTFEDNRDYPNLGRGVPAATLQAGDIQTEINYAVQQNGWSVNADSVFFLYIPEEVQACNGAGECTASTVNGDACGFHDTTTIDNQQVVYAVIPSPGDTAGCDSTVTSPHNDLMVDNAINAEAHELVEGTVNPLNFTGWSDPVADSSATGGEVADKCASDFPGRGSVLADGGDITLNGHDYILQSLWSDLDGGCTLGRVPPPYIDSLNNPVLAIGASNATFAVDGHSFAPTATVDWNGTPLPTTFISDHGLVASVPANLLANQSVASITVVQTNTTGGTSNPQLLYVLPNGNVSVTGSGVAGYTGGAATFGSSPNMVTLTSDGGSGTFGYLQFGGDPLSATLPPRNSGGFFEAYASPNSFSGLT